MWSKSWPLLCCSFMRIHASSTLASSSAFVVPSTVATFLPSSLGSQQSLASNKFHFNGSGHHYSSVTSHRMTAEQFTEGPSTSLDFGMDPYSLQARSLTESLGISSEHHDLLSKHAELVVEWNSRLNLISRKDCNIEVVFGRHILPSLAIAALPNFPLPKNEDGSRPKANIIDVGTGGGFPGIPLAIIFPESNFLLVDSIGKKLKAVDEIVSALGLENVKTHHGRAEEIVDDPIEGRKQKNAFDICVGRSVTSMPRFCFWIQDLLKRGGRNGKEEGRLVYIIGGEVEESVVSKVISDIAIDELLQCEGASDKRTLILSASDVDKVANESGERRQKRGPGKKNKKTETPNRNAKSNDDGEWNRSKGGWAKKDNSVKKQRGYEKFKRYGTH